jgi:serine/threonine protein kinase
MSGAKVGTWNIEKRLGQGSLGQVFLVRQEGNGPRAALKLFTEEAAQGTGVSLRLEREMNVLHKLRHENLVRLQGSGEHQGQAYFLMEYIDGPTLAFLLEEQGHLPWPLVVQIAMQICRGLHHAYLQDVVHRNLKPSNVFCTPEGVVKVSECGINKCFGETAFTGDGSLIGSADYLSPEQAAAKPATRQSDLYSLGVICYQLLTGRLPFLAETESQMLHQHRHGRVEPPSKRVKDLPPELEQLVLELLEKDPEKRPGSAALVENRLVAIRTKHSDNRGSEEDKLQANISRALGHKPKPKSPLAEETEEESVPWSRVALLGVMLLLVVAALIYGLWPTSPETVLGEVQVQVEQSNWNDADAKLNRHAGKFTESPYRERAAELREKIKQGMALKQLPRATGTVSFVPPSGEAERLFRRGIMEYYQGQSEKAKRTWEQLIVAFADIPSQATWVQQARRALDDAAKARPTYQELEDALARAEKEKPEEARKRLENLRDLYAELPPDDPKLQALLAKLKQKLKELSK